MVRTSCAVTSSVACMTLCFTWHINMLTCSVNECVTDKLNVELKKTKKKLVKLKVMTSLTLVTVALFGIKLAQVTTTALVSLLVSIENQLNVPHTLPVKSM